MAVIIVGLQLIAVVTGLVSAYYWWRSAEKPKMTKTLPENVSDHALTVTVGDDHIVYDISGQARLSGLGAKWAAASILMQAACTALTSLAVN